jgi:hypothetical protein
MSAVPRRYLAVAVLAVLAVVLGTVGTLALGAATSAKDRIEADPPPTLFAAVYVDPLGRQVDAQAAPAHALMQHWWRGHDHMRRDAEFTAWLERALPGPPPAAQRAAEVAHVVALARTRTPTGIRSSTWLERHGKKDVWKLYAHDQAEMEKKGTGEGTKQAVKDALKLSKTIADTLGAKYQQSAPYVLHPALRADHVVKPGQVCPCSYPSRHAAAGAAATAYLVSLDPHRAGEYHWMQAEVDYSRIYMAGHTVSDITGGALLGDMVGEYVARTRG